MDDMISKQQAVNALYEWEFDNKDDRDAIDVINGLPPIQPNLLQPWEVLVAQAVLPQPEIVRCRDCKHLSNDRITPEFNRVCRLYGCGKKEYGFCDEGERRTDE